MRAVISVLAFVCICTFSFAQNNQNDSYPKQKSVATLSAAVFPYYCTGPQPGIQLQLGKKYSLISEAGWGTSKSRFASYQEIHGLKLTSELKHYPKHASAGRYYSCQIGYIKRNFQDKDSGFYSKDKGTSWIGYSSVNIQSPVSFLTIKWGKEVVPYQGFFIDFFVGAGVRHGHTTYNARGSYRYPGSVVSKEDSITDIIGKSWDGREDFWKPNFSLGIRLGIRI